MLANDPVLTAFHKANVDNSFQARIVATTVRSASALTVLTNQLAALSLPTAVSYALKAMGAGMVAAIADGPLPIGDILLAAATANAAIVIAANWSTISSKWNSIVSAFTTAFSTMLSNVKSAFTEIKSEVPNVQSATLVAVTSKDVVIDGTMFYCRTAVNSLTKAQVGNNRYYVGVLALGNVWVDATKPIGAGFARFIIAANNPVVGVVATTQSYARGVAGGHPVGPQIHGGSGYYYHYHNALHRQAHIWYPNVDLV